jgi:hypothetical protein
MRQLYIGVILMGLLTASCQKTFKGYCISGNSPSNYQVLEFFEKASSKRAAERQIEKIMNERFPTNGSWSCEVND